MNHNNSKDNYNRKIKQYRSQIDDIDKKILSLMVERQQEVQKVMALKKDYNVAVYHPAREEDLISRLRSRANNARLNPDMIEDIYRTVLRYSRVSQSGQLAQKCIRPGARILFIGGGGQMGQYFSTLFSGAGYEVAVLEKQDWDYAPSLCRDIDLAVVSVPISATEAVIRRIAPHLSPQTILADLTSIKEPPVTAMLDAHDGPVLGLHPLFGPTLSSLDRQIIVATPGRLGAQCRWVMDQLSLWGAIMVTATAKEHDDIMAIVQSLRHFATFCFGSFLSGQLDRPDRTLEFSSPIYRLELGMVGRLFAQDSDLYAQIIFATKERRQLLKEYIHSLTSHLDMLENNDKDQFVEKFNEIARWFGPFSDQALRESTFIINKLIERF